MVVLAGHTGAGKTELLGALRDQGQQVIDLEGLANHRGSAFGGIGQPTQPTVEQFENLLFLQWRTLDPTRPVWIEGESRSIGRVQIPQSVWDQMSDAPMIFVEVDRERRVDFLVREYGDFPADQLSSAIQRISKRLGGARLQAALNAMERGDMRTVAACVLEYYDKSYSQSLRKRGSGHVLKFPLSRPGQADAATKLIPLGTELTDDREIADLPVVPANVELSRRESPSRFMFRL